MAVGGLWWANWHEKWNIWSSIQRHFSSTLSYMKSLGTLLPKHWSFNDTLNVSPTLIGGSLSPEEGRFTAKVCCCFCCCWCWEETSQISSFDQVFIFILYWPKKKISVFQQTWLVWPCSVRPTAWGLKQTPALSPVRTVPHRDFSSTQEKTCRLQKLDIWNRTKRS